MKQTVNENVTGERIKEKRDAFGLNQKELAEKVGVSPSAINQYEAGSKNPSTDILKAIAIALETETDYLLGIKEEDDEIAVAFRDLGTLTEKDRQIVLGNIRMLKQMAKGKK
ncbi:MAG TPA: helix-turn-helix transcriptional regulator [Nitrospirota bacterium]